MTHTGTFCYLVVTVATVSLCSAFTSIPRETDNALMKVKVHPEDHWFLDSDGRVSFFHGVNCVQKCYPWYPEYLLNKTRLDDLKEFGMNIVRLGTMWTGVEPMEGQYNSTYINILKQITKNLSDRGIYVMLDMHQDALSGKYPPSYDGIPPWIVAKFPPPTNPYPWPFKKIDFWEEGYATQAVSEGFQHLYNNTNSALDKWGDFWAHVASEFKNDTSVLGYNLINEPWIGDYFKHPELILSGVAGAENLLPVYDYLNQRIREMDREGIIFYDPVFYGQFLHGDLLGSGFDRVPGGKQYRNVSAFSYHTYCWLLEFLPPEVPDVVKRAAQRRCASDFLPRMFSSAARNVAETGGASILTEFGHCINAGDQINVECEVFFNLADQHLQSWINWDYDYEQFKWYNPDGSRNMTKITGYVRPYPRAVAGIPKLIKFDPKTLEFKLEFEADAKIKSPTELFVPRLRYKNGYDINVEASSKWRVEQQDQLVFLFLTEKVGGKPSTIIITITPK